MLYDPYVLPCKSEASLDWSEFDTPNDPTIGSGNALLSAATIAHEKAVYEADPTGGALGHYA